MTILYKLTDRGGRTRAGYSNETQWGEGVTHRAADGSRELCTNTVIHAYVSPELAMLLNPAHADIHDPLLWEADGEIVVRQGDLKVGVIELTTHTMIPAPTATTTQIVAFAILCAKAVYSEPTFLVWADGWLSSENRSAQAAAAIEATARAAAARTMTAEAAAAAALAAAEAAACEAAPEAEVARLAALAATMAGPAIDLPAIAKQALVSDWSGK